MPRRPARTARSSSRSSKRTERASDTEPEVGWLAVGEVVGAHGLGGLLRVRPYQPPAPSLVPERAVRLVQGAEREHLIPVVAEIVRAIDRAGRRVVIDPSPGLLD